MPEVWLIRQIIHLMRNLKFMDIKRNVNRRMVSKNGPGMTERMKTEVVGRRQEVTENNHRIRLDRATNRTCKSDEGDIE